MIGKNLKRKKRKQYNPKEILKRKIVIKSIGKQEKKQEYYNLPIEMTNEDFYHKRVRAFKKLFHFK